MSNWERFFFFFFEKQNPDVYLFTSYKYSQDFFPYKIGLGSLGVSHSDSMWFKVDHTSKKGNSNEAHNLPFRAAILKIFKVFESTKYRSSNFNYIDGPCETKWRYPLFPIRIIIVLIIVRIVPSKLKKKKGGLKFFF